MLAAAIPSPKITNKSGSRAQLLDRLRISKNMTTTLFQDEDHR